MITLNLQGKEKLLKEGYGHFSKNEKKASSNKDLNKTGERILSIDNTRVERIVNAFFGENTKFKLNSHELVQTGQMAPKEVVTIISEKEKDGKKSIFLGNLPIIFKVERNLKI